MQVNFNDHEDKNVCQQLKMYPLFRNLDSPVSTCPISLETSLKTPRHQSFDEGKFGGIFNNATDNLDRKKVSLQRNDEDVAIRQVTNSTIFC